jgi:hypothetical protein
MTTDAKKEVSGSLVEPWAARKARHAPAQAARRAALLAEIDDARIKAGLPPITPPTAQPIKLRPQLAASHGRLSRRRARLVLYKSQQRDAQRDAAAARKAARLAGAIHYRGLPCIHGHGAGKPWRLVSNNACTECRRLDKQRTAVKLKQGLSSRPEGQASEPRGRLVGSSWRPGRYDWHLNHGTPLCGHPRGSGIRIPEAAVTGHRYFPGVKISSRGENLAGSKGYA